MENVYVGGIDEFLSCWNFSRFCFCTRAALANAPCIQKAKITRAEKRLSFVNLIDILRCVFVPALTSCHDELSGLIQFNIELIFGSCRRRRPLRSNTILI